MELTRNHAGQPWRARQREILNRIVRETDPPTGSLPRITVSRELDDEYSARVGEVLDLAGTIGAILMASGMPATATMDQVTAITGAYGIERCEVDVINTTIHVSAYRGPTSAPASTLHIVQSRSMDFSRLAAVDRLIGRIRAGEVSPSDARDELDAISTAPHPYKRWIATLAWGALAFATAGTLGASLLACAVSALSAMTIDRVNRRLNRHGLPFFFQYAVGGAIATAPPLVLYWLSPRLGLHFEPTVAIAAGLVVLLAGLSLVGSVGATRFSMTSTPSDSHRCWVRWQSAPRLRPVSTWANGARGRFGGAESRLAAAAGAYDLPASPDVCNPPPLAQSSPARLRFNGCCDAGAAVSDVHVAESHGEAQTRAVVAPHTPDTVRATDTT